MYKRQAQGVRAAESLLIAVSGKSGVDVGTEKAYKMAKDLSKATDVYKRQLLSYVPAAREFCTIDAVQILNIDSTNLQPEHRCV